MRVLAVLGLVGIVGLAFVLALAGGNVADRVDGGHEGVLERLRKRITTERVEREEDPVKMAQRALRARGYDIGEVDGQLGPKTRAAVRTFQRDEGLRVTGRLDTGTMARLRNTKDEEPGSASPRQHERDAARRDDRTPAAAR